MTVWGEASTIRDGIRRGELEVLDKEGTGAKKGGEWAGREKLVYRAALGGNAADLGIRERK